MKKIAIILPDRYPDYLANTVLDGFRAIEPSGECEVRISPRFIAVGDYHDWELDDESFEEYARRSDLIIFIHAKYTTKALVEKIGLWDKTVVVDGNEVGKDNRYDPDVRKALEEGTYKHLGRIESDLLKRCRRYFRREKPYVDGIIPFPFGIEERFVRYRPGQEKDIDFACIFGQEEFPTLRRDVREAVEGFCSRNGFKCVTSKTRTIFNRDYRNSKSQGKFHEILARTKVGISVGGGGFDTLRFWEILANGCALLTETIDIYEPGSDALRFSRVKEFKDLDAFKARLEEMGQKIRSGELAEMLGDDEYRRIIARHSSERRVRDLLEASFQ